MSADEDTNWRDHRNKPLTETGNGNNSWRTIQSKSKNRKIQGSSMFSKIIPILTLESETRTFFKLQAKGF